MSRFFLVKVFVIFFCIFCHSLVEAKAAAIELVMPSNIGKNQVFPVQVYLDTQKKQTVGTDLLFSFDPSDMTFVQVDEADFYSNYHEAKIFLDRGQIRYSGTSNYNEYKAGDALFATFFFKKKKIGKPQLNLMWQEGRTDDTNVIGVDGEELLTSVPVVKYDNSLRDKPKSESDKPGKVLGGQDLSNEFLSLSVNPNAVFGEATPIQREVSKNWIWIICLVALIPLVIFFIWKKKKKKQKSSTVSSNIQ